MLSNVLADETIEAPVYIPSRMKSGYSKLVDEANQSKKKHQRNRSKYEDNSEDDDEENQYYRPSRAMSGNMYNDSTGNFDANSSSQNRMVANRGSSRSSQNTFDQPQQSYSEALRSKNTLQRLHDLEKANLTLRRMLQFVATDPSRSIDRTTSAVPKLLVNRQSVAHDLGPPSLRQGRIGSNWRHIKQTNNYSNSNLLFIDGTVRINDSARFPPKIYGYPPKVLKYDEDLIGQSLPSFSELPISARVKNRQHDLSAYSNQFHERAKNNFQYWTKDPREPENNKLKAKLYTTGAYKTFYGLSDSLLKT